MLNPRERKSAISLFDEDGRLLADMTNWAKPEYPRNQVDEAGFILTKHNATLEEIAWSLDVINNWRSSHSYPLLNFRINLARKLKTIQPKAVIAQRIKRLTSIKAKLVKQSTMQLSQMQDVGGCRAVVGSVRSLERLVSSYNKSTFAHLFK